MAAAGSRRPVCRHGPFTRGVAVLLLTAMAGTGCYRSVPLATAPAPGERVSVTLTPAGAAAMHSVLGPDVRRVDGEVIGTSATEWQMRMLSTEANGTGVVRWNGETLAFTTSHLASMERRELDRNRTWLAAGAITVAALVLGRVFLGGILGEDKDRDTGEVPPH